MLYYTYPRLHYKTLDSGRCSPSSTSFLAPGVRAPAMPCSEVLQRLSDAGLEYRLGPSRGGEYIFCAVRLPELCARANLSFYPMDLL